MRNFLRVFIVAAVFMHPGCSKAPSYPTPPIKEEGMIINVGSLNDADSSFFSVEMDGTTVRFFVLKISNNVEAYFDACQKCYRDTVGYRTEGASVVCRSCGVTYPLDQLKEGIGSCRPVPVPGILRGNRFIIPLDELRKGTQYF